MLPSVLVIDDDPKFAGLVADVLSSNDFAVSIATSGPNGLRQAREMLPSLVLLDLWMPGMKGFEVCQKLKEDSTTSGLPILIITANDKEGQEIACLDMGADDYLVKPVKKDRLIARCRALLRRAKGTEAPAVSVVEVAGVKLDYAAKTVLIGGVRHQELTPIEFGLLYELARRSPNPMDRAELYRQVWGIEAPSEGSLRTVEVHVRRIRLKLGWKSGDWLQTITGRGYAFIPPVAR